MSTAPALVVATGLLAEARIAAGSGIVTVAGGGDSARLALLLQAALAEGARGVVSFGIAGGLRADLAPGTVVIARGVLAGAARLDTHAGWRRRLVEALPHAVVDDVAGVDGVVAGPAGKAALHRRTGAAAVDMETHVAARIAARHNLPFAAVRVIADPAHRGVPQAAVVGMRADGTTDPLAVLRALGRHPGEIAGLIRTALDARVAFAALRQCRGALAALVSDDIAPELAHAAAHRRAGPPEATPVGPAIDGVRAKRP